MSRRWRYPRSRRGVFYGIVRAPAAPAAPAFPPLWLRADRRPAYLIRRGEFWPVPKIGAAPTLPPWIPAMTEGRRGVARPVRRGRYFPVPLIGAAPPPPAPWIPPNLDGRRTPARPVRRGRHFPIPPAALPPVAPGRCPDRITSRGPGIPGTRRGRTWTTPRVAPTPPVPPVDRIRSRRTAAALRTRRGAYAEPFLIGVAPSPVIDFETTGRVEAGPYAALVEAQWRTLIEPGPYGAQVEPDPLEET